MIDD
jgi:uncharacterized protein YutD